MLTFPIKNADSSTKTKETLMFVVVFLAIINLKLVRQTRV